MNQENSDSEIPSLRSEVVESQKARVDLLKYKLVAIAILGAIGLGFNTYQSTNFKIEPDYILCIIPFVCVYVDLLCWHNTLRILVIGRYLNYKNDPYENFLYHLGKDTPHKNVGYFFELEDFALLWSTILVSSLILIYGVYLFFRGSNSYLYYMLLLAGLGGIVLPLYLDRYYNEHIIKLFKLSGDLFGTRNFVHNEKLKELIRPYYTLQEVREIRLLLESKGTFDFPTLENGLYPAALLQKEKEYTGYNNIWVRDNIHIANAQFVLKNYRKATKNVSSLMRYFKKYKSRFEKIITNKSDPKNPMNRPHVRFDSQTMSEIDEKWAHAQNDALAYFVWFFCKLAAQKFIIPQEEDLEVLALFVLYFKKIQFWEDEDSGHWEETRKISASSIGTVVAALKVLSHYLKSSSAVCHYKNQLITDELLDNLIESGTKRLYKILPSECIQPDPQKLRRFDAALLFLIYPLHLVEEEVGEQILRDIINNLQGEYGIRRYLGDSYWAPNYKKTLKKTKHSIDYSDDMASRDRLLTEEGLEAQWCIFDSIISIIYGEKYQKNSCSDDLIDQTKYLNRALGQITHENCQDHSFRCPELYYLEDNEYIINDHVPLLWAQANLITALKQMENSLSLQTRKLQRVPT